MKITPALLTINFHEGRSGTIDAIVIHVTEGDAASVKSWFNNPDANVSAHYMVQKDGTVVQFVHEADTAWHAGRVDHPTATIVEKHGGRNPNDWTIGIEHEGDGTHELTEAQRAASIALIRDICERRHIPLDRHHIVGHREIYSLKTCPGAIDVDRLVSEANAAVERPAPPRVVYSSYLNDWLIVTRVLTDTHWFYVRMKNLSKSGTVATVPLSSMPTSQP